MSEPIEVEATGETVGEAKWQALRELERRHPGLDRSGVRFQVVSEGERGLLGVGYVPARVVAAAVAPDPRPERGGSGVESETGQAERLRELLERIAEGLGGRCELSVQEDEESIEAEFTGGDLGVLIGRHGQTIDAVQSLANAIALRGGTDARKPVVVDASGYRARRRAALALQADDAAERALRGERVVLEPMTALERKIVHARLQETAGVVTASEGAEPNRSVVVSPVE